MITIDILGFKKLELNHLVLDYNGTIAFDGILLPTIAPVLAELSKQLKIYVITADTFGFAQNQLIGLPVNIVIIPLNLQAEAKHQLITELGANSVVAMGNGRNDAKMLKEAALGIGLIQKEGASVQTLTSADLICTDISDALSLLLNPKRLIATLRS